MLKYDFFDWFLAIAGVIVGAIFGALLLLDNGIIGVVAGALVGAVAGAMVVRFATYISGGIS
jgi:hypothetical protein